MSNRPKLVCRRCGQEGHAGLVYEDGRLPCPVPEPSLDDLRSQLAAAIARAEKAERETRTYRETHAANVREMHRADAEIGNLRAEVERLQQSLDNQGDVNDLADKAYVRAERAEAERDAALRERDEARADAIEKNASAMARGRRLSFTSAQLEHLLAAVNKATSPIAPPRALDDLRAVRDDVRAAMGGDAGDEGGSDG